MTRTIVLIGLFLVAILVVGCCGPLSGQKSSDGSSPQIQLPSLGNSLEGCWGAHDQYGVLIGKLTIDSNNKGSLEMGEYTAVFDVTKVGDKTFLKPALGSASEASIQNGPNGQFLRTGDSNYTKIACGLTVPSADEYAQVLEAKKKELQSKCGQGQMYCDGGCKTLKCSKASDCGSAGIGFEYSCSNPDSCSAACIKSNVTECVGGDNFCPVGCSVLKDSDCPALSFGTPEKITDDLTLTLSNPTDRHCVSDYGSDFGSYFVVTATFENVGSKKSDYVSSSDISVTDSTGEEYSTSTSLYGNCDDNNILYGLELMPGQTMTKNIWFRVISQGDYKLQGKLNVIYDPNGLYNYGASRVGEKVFTISR